MIGDAKVRAAEIRDCNRLTALSLQVWLDTYAMDGINDEIAAYVLSLFTPKKFETILTDDTYRALVYTENGCLRGYVLINLNSRFKGEKNGFEIDKLYVQEPFQGRGIGRALLEAVKKRFGSPFWLYTWVRNRSIGFYKHYGFRDIGRYDLHFKSRTVENRVLVYGRSE